MATIWQRIRGAPMPPPEICQDIKDHFTPKEKRIANMMTIAHGFQKYLSGGVAIIIPCFIVCQNWRSWQFWLLAVGAALALGLLEWFWHVVHRRHTGGFLLSTRWAKKKGYTGSLKRRTSLEMR